MFLFKCFGRVPGRGFLHDELMMMMAVRSANKKQESGVGEEGKMCGLFFFFFSFHRIIIIMNEVRDLCMLVARKNVAEMWCIVACKKVKTKQQKEKETILWMLKWVESMSACPSLYLSSEWFEKEQGVGVVRWIVGAPSLVLSPGYVFVYMCVTIDKLALTHHIYEHEYRRARARTHTHTHSHKSQEKPGWVSVRFSHTYNIMLVVCICMGLWD